MARNGSGVYSLPAGSLVTNGDTSDATDLNTPLQDIAADLNIARPIVTGGTGATTAAGARTNLGATVTGEALFTAADAAAGRAALGVETTFIASLLSGLAGPTATTSGVAIDFTDIPTDAVRIEVLLQDCRVDGGRSYRIQIGAGAIEETGYAAVSDVNGASPVAYTDAFGILPFSAASKTEGIFHLHLADPATNTWVASYSMRASDFGVTRGGGRKAISGPIERLRVRTTGPDVFNSGAISLRWSRV